MLQTINLILNSNSKIRNFEEDKIATLRNNPGLRYIGEKRDKNKKYYNFSGNFYLTNKKHELIETFEVSIYLDKNKYPNVFPLVFSIDDKIKKDDDYHISKDGLICTEHHYISNRIASAGLRLHDFMNYYLPKYFSWVLVKSYGNPAILEEWAHNQNGTKQLYESLLETQDKKFIHTFITNYLIVRKIRRNDKCYCGNNTKLKKCHYQTALFLKSTPKNEIINDLLLFQL